MAEPPIDRALLIGVRRYQDERFPSIEGARHSLEGMRRMLIDPGAAGWPRECVTARLDPVDSRQVITEIREAAETTTGTLLLYFVGHGAILPTGKVALAVTDTRRSQVDVTGVDYDYVRDALHRSPAQVKIVILDCCHSGRALEGLSSGEFAEQTEIRGTYSLAAAMAVAHVPPPREQRAGARTSFTGELLDLIVEGVPGGPRQLGLDDLYRHLLPRLRAAGLPEARQFQTDTVRDFPFVTNAAFTGDPRPPHRRAARPVPHRTWRRPLLAAVATVAGTCALAFSLIALTTTAGGSGTAAHTPQTMPTTANTTPTRTPSTTPHATAPTTRPTRRSSLAPRRNLKKTPTPWPPFHEIPSGFLDRGCLFDVTNDDKRGAAPRQILKGGSVDQEFTPSSSYIWTLRAVIGHNDLLGTLKIRFSLTDGSKVLFQGEPDIINNGGTESRFPPIRVRTGRRYHFIVTNITTHTLGIYTAPTNTAINPERLNTLTVHNEERRPDGTRPTDYLTSCVGGADKA